VKARGERFLAAYQADETNDEGLFRTKRMKSVRRKKERKKEESLNEA
jgi:hypothetical protein